MFYLLAKTILRSRCSLLRDDFRRSRQEKHRKCGGGLPLQVRRSPCSMRLAPSDPRSWTWMPVFEALGIVEAVGRNSREREKISAIESFQFQLRPQEFSQSAGRLPRFRRHYHQFLRRPWMPACDEHG